MSKKRISSNYITQLAPNEVFVFGSNLKSMHGGGAARLAIGNLALSGAKALDCLDNRMPFLPCKEMLKPSSRMLMIF